MRLIVFPEGNDSVSKALIVVDVQNDFCEGGSLPVAGGLEVAAKIYQTLSLRNPGQYWSKVLATKDWHDASSMNGGHFSHEPDYIDTWPIHCVASSEGASLAGMLFMSMFDDVFLKGRNEPAYSGFQGSSCYNTRMSLGGYLGLYEFKEVDICGIATDYCVKATALDALERNLKVNVISDWTVAVGDKQAALDEMERAGATIV